MRAHAHSPRGFDVGVAALVRSRGGHHLVLGGANHKTDHGPRRHRNGDYCGEMEIIAAAREMKCEVITDMTITAPHQADDMSGRDFGVTVSCFYCRVEFRHERKNPESPLKGYTRLRFNHPTNKRKFHRTTVDEFLSGFPDDPLYIPAE